MQNSNKNMRLINTLRGFTLLEIAVVLLIIGLVTGGLLGPLSNQIKQNKIAETKKLLEENRDALLGFAASNGYLPCPAKSASDGTEDRTSGDCTSNHRVGFIPWVTLGTPKSDSWGRLLRYGVSPTFSRSPTASTAKVTLASPGDISIRTRDTAGTLVGLAGNVPVIIQSHGPNGFGGTTDNGAVIVDTSSTNADEETNLNNGAPTLVISRTYTENPSAPGGEFDDQIIWIPTAILFNRMVAAGQLP